MNKVKDEANALGEAHLAVAGGDGRSIRHRAGLTLEDLSKLVGASFGTVASWERGSKYPSLENAISYGRVLRKLQAKSVKESERE